MRGLTYMLSKYSDKAMTLKLRNKWVDIDPREWKTQFNMTVNVGLGTGNRDIQLQHLMALHAQQVELMKVGKGYMVSDENLYNLYNKISEAMGFKHPELFVTDPQKVPPQAKQPPPDPQMVKAQMDAQEGQAKLQFAGQKEQLNAQTEQAIAQINAQTQVAIAQMNNASAEKIAQMKISADAQLAVFDKQGAGQDANLEAQKMASELETGRAVASEKARLERDVAEAKVMLEVFKAREQAKLAKETASAQIETEGMKAEAAVTAAGAKTPQAKQAENKEKQAEKKASMDQSMMMTKQHQELMQTLGKVIEGKGGKKKISFVKDGDSIVGAEIGE